MLLPGAATMTIITIIVHSYASIPTTNNTAWSRAAQPATCGIFAPGRTGNSLRSAQRSAAGEQGPRPSRSI